MLLRRYFLRMEKSFFSTVKTQIQQKPTLAHGERVVFRGPAAEPCLSTEQAELPQISEGEILGQIKAATICGSDLHTFLGKRNEPVPRYSIINRNLRYINLKCYNCLKFSSKVHFMSTV